MTVPAPTTNGPLLREGVELIQARIGETLIDPERSELVRFYIAGPMAGIHNFNFDAFHWVASRLRAGGDEAVNPAELDDLDPVTPSGVDPETATVLPAARAEYLRRDFRHLIECDAVVLLPGWERSTGANAELWVARTLGLLVYRWEPGVGGGQPVYDPEARPSDLLLQAHWDATTLDPMAALGRAWDIDREEAWL